MKYSKLDTIVRGVLLNKGYSLHWYMQALKYASDCLRELSMDDLKIINSIVLTLNSYYAAPIPDGCIDWIRFGMENGPYIKPFAEIDTLNRTYNYGPGGNPQPWPSASNGQANDFGFPFVTYFVNSFNTHGENTGGMYGYRSDGVPFTYQIMKERNEIQFDRAVADKKIVLDFISDGRSSSAASMVDTYAENTIENYLYWQFEEHKRTTSDSTKERLYQKYVGARTVLRGRENPMGVQEILASFRNNYHASIKT